MSHEGISAFDNRSDNQIQIDENNRLRKEAEKQLMAEGTIQPLTIGDRAWLDREMAVTARAEDISDKKTYERLKNKFG